MNDEQIGNKVRVVRTNHLIWMHVCNFQNTRWFKPFMGFSWVTIMSKKVVKTLRSDRTPSKAIPILLNVHVYFAKACRCRVAIPQISKLTKTAVTNDGARSKQPSSFRHVTSLDGHTCGNSKPDFGQGLTEIIVGKDLCNDKIWQGLWVTWISGRCFYPKNLQGPSNGRVWNCIAGPGPPRNHFWGVRSLRVHQIVENN